MNSLLFRFLTFFLKLISLLPFSVLYLISDLLFVILYHIIKYRRKVVMSNLRNSFPEKTADELHQIEKDYYSYLADLMVESIKSISISESEIKERFTVKNLEAVTDHLNAGQSLIAVSGHFGNWEWGPLRVGLALKQKTLVVYKPLSDSRFGDYINNIRGKFGTEMVAMRNTFRRLHAAKEEPHLLVLIGDQTPPREETQFFIPFLNQPTAVFLGIEKIAKRMQYPLVYFSINRLKRGYYECSIVPIVEDPQSADEHQITRIHTRMLEEDIKRSPETWLWSHRRWKFKPEDHV